MIYNFLCFSLMHVLVRWRLSFVSFRAYLSPFESDLHLLKDNFLIFIYWIASIILILIHMLSISWSYWLLYSFKILTLCFSDCKLRPFHSHWAIHCFDIFLSKYLSWKSMSMLVTLLSSELVHCLFTYKVGVCGVEKKKKRNEKKGKKKRKIISEKVYEKMWRKMKVQKVIKLRRGSVFINDNHVVINVRVDFSYHSSIFLSTTLLSF